MSFKPTEEHVSELLSRVRESTVLGRSERRLQLLEHLLLAEVRGNGDTLKAYSIGLDIFGKPDDFDPASDSIVRVEMGRLRMALAAFEGSEYADSLITTEIPTGSYRPIISKRSKALEPLENSGWRQSILGLALVLLIALLAALFGLGGRSEQSADISVEVADFEGPPALAELARSAVLSDLSRSSAIGALAPSDTPSTADFVLAGHITPVDDGYFVTVQLKKRDGQQYIWVRSTNAASKSDIPNRIKSEISEDLRIEIYGDFKELLADRDPATLSAAALFVLATWVPGRAINAVDWERERIALAELALQKDPEFGSAHSVLADKITYLANMDANANSADLVKKGLFHAQRALELSPQDPDAIFNVAQAHWHAGDIEESTRLMRRVIELDPTHVLARYLLIVVPYTCAAAPDRVIFAATDLDQTLTASNPVRWLTLTWIGWLHAFRGEWEEALDAEQKAAVIFEVPYASMRHAMVLHQLGRIGEARKVIERQRANWPNLDPWHFAEVTYPRLCRGSADADRYVHLYTALAESLEPRN